MSADRQPLERYFRALRSVDPSGASDVVLDLFDGGMPVGGITRDVLVPAQVRVGELWQLGEWSVADEHAATAVTESAVLALEHASRPHPLSHQRHIVFACAEGEWHTLPARMAAVVAANCGTRVTVLGPSLSADQLGLRLSAGDVDLLALSCTVAANMLGAARCIAAAHEQNVPVLAGGRAFAHSPRRAQAVGADGWSDDPAALRGPTPAQAGRAVEPTMEVLALDAVDPAVVALVFDRMVAAIPPLDSVTSGQRASACEQIRLMSRYAAAALLTGDPSIVEELLRWLCVLAPGSQQAEIITMSALLLADAVEPEAPGGAALLRAVAGTVTSGSAARGDPGSRRGAVSPRGR